MVDDPIWAGVEPDPEQPRWCGDGGEHPGHASPDGGWCNGIVQAPGL